MSSLTVASSEVICAASALSAFALAVCSTVKAALMSSLTVASSEVICAASALLSVARTTSSVAERADDPSWRARLARWRIVPSWLVMVRLDTPTSSAPMSVRTASSSVPTSVRTASSSVLTSVSAADTSPCTTAVTPLEASPTISSNSPPGLRMSVSRAFSMSSKLALVVPCTGYQADRPYALAPRM